MRATSDLAGVHVHVHNAAVQIVIKLNSYASCRELLRMLCSPR
jgi:hypothetical protein